MANTDRNNPTNNENIDLVSEVGGRCPMPGCNAELMQEKNNRTIKNYEIAHIYPHSPTTIEQNILNGVPLLYKNSPDEKENLIALCVSCHSRFDNTRTKDEYMELYNKKLQVLKNNEITNILNNHKLQDEIESVIKAIVNITSIATENDLNYDPVTIDKKLKSVLLINKVRGMVQPYYLFIDEQFKSFGLNDNQYRSILMTFKHAYVDISARESDEQKIFLYLVNWLQTESKISDRIANEVLISYFIQHCEVFDVISK